VIAAWEGDLDRAQAAAVLDGKAPASAAAEIH